MARTFSTLAVAGVLIVGLIVGGAGAFLYYGQTGSTSTSVSTLTTTVFSTVTTGSSTSTTSQSGQPTPADLQSALENSGNATLTVASYNFGKGTLAAWIDNSGSSPIVLTVQQFLFNGSFVGNTYLTNLDPTVKQMGIYYYIPPNGQIIVQLTPNTAPLGGRNSTLTVLNNVFTFAYGTSKD